MIWSVSFELGSLVDCSYSLCLDSIVKSQKFFLVAMAEGSHPFPSRTRKLSPLAPMVLPWRRGGRVGNCQVFFSPASNSWAILLCARHGTATLGPACWSVGGSNRRAKADREVTWRWKSSGSPDDRESLAEQQLLPPQGGVGKKLQAKLRPDGTGSAYEALNWRARGL